MDKGLKIINKAPPFWNLLLEKYPGPGTYATPSEFGHYTIPKGN